MTTASSAVRVSDLADPRTVRIVAGTTEAVFEWREDRFGHRVRAVTSEGMPLVFESIEGAGEAGGRPDPRWPASPVIAALAEGDQSGGALVGIGAAGRTHFSLAVTPHATLRDTLVFEVACRVRDAPQRLGSAYRRTSPDDDMVILGPAGEPADSGLPRTIRWTYAIGPAGIAPA